MFNTILVVCVGNICRSPTVEFILRQSLDASKFTVTSAGLGALVGHEMDSTAAQILQQYGYSKTTHAARQINEQIIRDNTLILVMEKAHLQAIHDLVPSARGKTFLLTQWLEKQDIPDPYKKSQTMFEHVFTLMEKACQSWLKHLI